MPRAPQAVAIIEAMKALRDEIAYDNEVHVLGRIVAMVRKNW